MKMKCESLNEKDEIYEKENLSGGDNIRGDNIREIRRIDTGSLANMVGAFGAVIVVICAMLYSIEIFTEPIGVFVAVFGAAIYGFMGFILFFCIGLVVAATYNVVAGRFGGIKVQLE